MKKRLISLLLALAMIMSLMPMSLLSVSAEEAEAPAATESTPAEETTAAAQETEATEPGGHNHCVCGGGLEGHDHADTQWIAWGDAEAEKTKLPSAPGNYYLTDTINLTGTWYVTGKTIHLCLNGHTVNGGGASAGNPNTIMMGNTADNVSESSISRLVISDCQGSGLIQSDANVMGGALRFRNDPYATVEIYGGELRSTVKEGTVMGGAVYMDNGSLYLYGGTVTGGDALYQDSTTGDKNGGAVCLKNAAQFYMYGGTINGGTDYNRGAGVALRGSASAAPAFYMYGGTIQGGSSNFGDAIHCDYGKAYIEAGTIDVYSGDNLHVTNGGSVTIKTASFPKGICHNASNIADIMVAGSYLNFNGAYHAAATKALQGDIVIGNHAAHCVCGGAVDHDCSDITWSAWTNSDSLPTTNGNYFLATDVKLTNQWNLQTKEINLCLNGHTVTGAGDTAQTIMMGTVNNADSTVTTNLAISDCKGGGVVQTNADQHGSVLRVRADAYVTVDIYGGTFRNNAETARTKDGPVVRLYGGKVNLYSGTIVGVDSSDGTINGGALYLDTASEFNMYGGELVGASGYQRGGAVAVRNANAVFNMYGGTITGGSATFGNAIHNDNGTVYIDGGIIDTPTSGNGNLHVNSGSLIIKTASFPQGIKLYSANAIHDQLREILEDGSYIISNDGNYVMGTGGSILVPSKVLVSEHVHCVCGGAVKEHDCDTVGWMAWSSTTSLPSTSGYYYLTEDVVLAGAWDWGNKTINLCLNGHTVTGKGGTAQTIMLGNTAAVEDTYITKLAITDCDETAGKIVSNSNQSGAIIRARAYGNITIDLYNGTLDATCEASVGEGGAVALYSGTFNMYGGTLDGCATDKEGSGDKTSYKNGGTVAVHKGSFNMYSGTITGGKAAGESSYGGNVYVNGGSFNMYDGTISDGTAVMGGGNIYVRAGSFKLVDGIISGGTVIGTARMGGNLWVGGGTADLIGGTISGGKAAHGGNLRLTGGTMNLSGTTVTGGEAVSNGGNLSFTDGTFNMTGGELKNGHASCGGNIYVNAANGTLNLTGGKIADGEVANQGGNIFCNAGKVINIGKVTIEGGSSVSYGGSLYVKEDVTVAIDGATITNTDEAVTASKGGVIYSEGTLTVKNATISGGYANTSPSGGTICVAAGTTTIDNSTLNAGWGSRGTCINVCGNGQLTVKDSTINGRTALNELSGSTSIGTCCWIEGNGILKLVGNVQITGEGLDIIRDLRTGNAYTDISELAIETDTEGNVEKISVRMQTAQAGQVLYAGTNADAINMVEPFLANYQSLTVNGEWIETVMDALVGYDANGNVKGFDSWDDAMAESLERIVVYSPVSGTISKNIVLDLNGISLTDIVINEGVTVQLIDSQTNDFAGEYGRLTGTVNGTVEALVTYGGQNYLVVNDEGTYSAHCYEVKLTHVSLDASNDALGYKAELFGDDVVMSHVSAFGFNLWVDGGSVKTYSKTGTKTLTLRLKNIMAAGGGEMNINANAFVTFDVSDEKITSPEHTTTMKDTIVAVNALEDLTEDQKAAVYGLYEQYSELMDSWLGENNNIKTWAPAAEEA